MLHLLYITAFVLLSALAITNLFRNLMTLGTQSRQAPTPPKRRPDPNGTPPHPELLDTDGNFTDEPLLVMRSISVNDARERLDALYEGKSNLSEEVQDD